VAPNEVHKRRFSMIIGHTAVFQPKPTRWLRLWTGR
jgi:hypothetical protein